VILFCRFLAAIRFAGLMFSSPMNTRATPARAALAMKFGILPGDEARARDYVMDRQRLPVTLRQTAGSRNVHMAVGVGWRRVDLGGADGVHARRDRLAESATDVAAQKRWLERVD
jgi:hypothetical protein